ncbi:hypothetical protein GOBAR_AA11200 [Gossypium barbadense]|uniref:MADS-box domain-containing protein n=1 Tax=Gossypium barbadense TaxID=3634 RepID=A0A2P5Y1K2_GOSBA|nr:hypothetical protein GOBAR_AA11200 [Gossypium barbadense]
MIRKKVKLAYITNDSSRKATYKKRKKGLMKKMSELSTFCGINACAIMCSHYESQPEDYQNNGIAQEAFKYNREKEMTQVMLNNIFDAFAMKPLYSQGKSSSPSSSMVALPPMTMVMPKVMLRAGTEDIMQLDMNSMDPIKRQQWIMELMNNNNSNPQTHVGGNEMIFSSVTTSTPTMAIKRIFFSLGRNERSFGLFVSFYYGL